MHTHFQKVTLAVVASIGIGGTVALAVSGPSGRTSTAAFERPAPSVFNPFTRMRSTLSPATDGGKGGLGVVTPKAGKANWAGPPSWFNRPPASPFRRPPAGPFRP